MATDTGFLAGHDLAVYTANWCPDCRRLKAWLAGTDVVSHDVSIDDVVGAAEKLEAETGKRGVPYVLVDGKHWVRGYHKELPRRFDPELFLSELREAIAAGETAR
jgi:glutaredoxin